jgi:hypothetical protein
MYRKAVAILLLTLFTSACASQQTAFRSEPAGARVSIDGEAIGVTPCNFSYKDGAGGSYEVTVEKEGFEAVRHTVTADEWDKPARNKWLAAGVVWSPLWLGTLFTRKLNDSYEFVLKKAPVLTARAEPKPSKRPL